MRRREFITLLGGAAAAWPLAARAQPERVRRIGWMMSLNKDDPEEQRRRAAFEQTLAQMGWVESRNIQIDYRPYFGEPARARAVAKELADLQPDLIVAVATPGLAAILQQTRTIPIVFIAVSDPVGQGFVAGLARPGGNATGLTFFEFSAVGKVLEALKLIAPDVARIALPFHPDTATTLPFLQSIEGQVPSLGIALVQAPVRDIGEIEAAIAAAARQPGGGLMFLPDPFTNFHRNLIVALAARYRVPAAYTQRPFVTSGGLISYGVDVTDLYRRAAPFVDSILKGTKPADLPVQQPTRYELVLNLKTARALGLDVPPLLLAIADEVIE